MAAASLVRTGIMSRLIRSAVANLPCQHRSIAHRISILRPALALRTMATVSKAAKADDPKSDAAKLLKTIDREIKVQQENLEEQDNYNINTILDDYSKLLKQQDWTLQAIDGQSTVRLARIENGISHTIYFDIQQVMNGIMASQEEGANDEFVEEEEYLPDAEDAAPKTKKAGSLATKAEKTRPEEAEEYAEDGEEIEEDGSSCVSFPLTMEIAAVGGDSQAKKLVIEGTADVFDRNDASPFHVSAVSVVAAASPAGASTKASASPSLAYEGPDFGSLDEDLQENLEKYVNKKFRMGELCSFILEYAEAREGHEYARWLQDVRNILSSS